MGTFALIVLVLAVAVVLYGVHIYNQLVALKNRYRNAFAQIGVQLTRRYDLIPNLVETAKAYMRHERETMEAVIAARNQAVAGLDQAAAAPGNAAALQQLAGAEQGLSQALGRFNMLMEAYPDLKASASMMQLSEEISSTENKVSFARQAYNDQVMAYNAYRQSFPAVLLAGSFGHGEDAALLEFANSQEIQQALRVSF